MQGMLRNIPECEECGGISLNASNAGKYGEEPNQR